MSDKEFMSFLDELRAYLEKEKVFVQNPSRVQNVARVKEIINELFPNSAVEIKNDQLQTGAIVLSFDRNDIVVRGQRELELFAELASLVDNFEIYEKQNKIHFAAVMQGVLIRIH